MTKVTGKILKKRTFKNEVYKRLSEETILKVLPLYLDKDKIAIDVGGNVGHIAYFLAQHSKTVHTFEAVPIVYEKLLAIKKKAANVEVHNFAVSNFNGKAKFYVDHLRLSNSGLSDLSAVETSFKKKTKFKAVKAKVITLDSMGFENVSLVKIDVEGTELDVLKGAEKLIAEQAPAFVIEIFEPFSKCPIEDLFQFMFDRGYIAMYYSCKTDRIFSMGEDMKLSLEVVKNRHDEHDGDFLFIKM